MIKFLLLLTLLALTSCGQDAIVEDGETRVLFRNEDGSRVSLDKGIMIYAHHLGQAKSMVIHGTSIAGLPPDAFLPNGQYLFYAYGFHGAGISFGINGGRYCGIANNGNPVGLFGGTTTVNITLAQTDDCPGPFAPNPFRINPGASNYNLKGVQIQLCTNNSLGSCSATSTSCYRVELVAHKRLIFGPETLGIHGDFTAATGTIGVSPPYLQLPFGGEFKIAIRKWSSSCGGTLGPPIIIDHGIQSLPTAANGMNVGIDNASNPVVLKLNDSIL